MCALLTHHYRTQFIMSNSSTTDKIEGDFHRAKGAVKEEAGYLVGNEKLEARGKAENIEGQVQKKVGDVKAALGSDFKNWMLSIQVI
jgi:uncharacterized protein YjbJ (UPF0337 family)